MKLVVIVAQPDIPTLLGVRDAINKADVNHKIIYLREWHSVTDATRSGEFKNDRIVIISGHFMGDDDQTEENLAEAAKRVAPGTVFFQYGRSTAYQSPSPIDGAIQQCADGNHEVLARIVAALTDTITLAELKEKFPEIK